MHPSSPPTSPMRTCGMGWKTMAMSIEPGPLCLAAEWPPSTRFWNQLHYLRTARNREAISKLDHVKSKRTTNAQRRRVHFVELAHDIQLPWFFFFTITLKLNPTFDKNRHANFNMDCNTTETGHSQEEIRSIMSFKHIDNPVQAHRLAYQGHSPFSNGGLGMSLLNSGFIVPPMASAGAYLEQLAFCGDGQDTASTIISTRTSRRMRATTVTVQATPRTLFSTPTESVPSGTSFDSGRESSPAYMAVFSEGYGECAQITKSAASSCSTHTTEKQSSGSPTNQKITRYEDGEVLRYGAGESYRPYNTANRDRERSPPPPPAGRRPRSPMRARSPIRARSPVRDRERDLRARSPPPIAPDSYVPNRSPRRRSRSPDRYRGPDRARDIGGESWRRRDVSRTRARSPLRRTPPRRRSPGRFSPGPRRDDRLFDRARSPRRDFAVRDR